MELPKVMDSGVAIAAKLAPKSSIPAPSSIVPPDDCVKMSSFPPPALTGVHAGTGEYLGRRHRR